VRRLNPLTGLRPRIAALVLGGVLVLAATMVQVSAHSVDGAYERSARTELTAIATTWEDGFDVSDLADPELMAQRVQRLQELNPNLTKIAVSWHDIHGRTRVAEAGDVPGERVAAIDAGARSYRRSAAGAGRHAEIHHPVGPGPDAMLELHYDLAALDKARAAEGLTLWLIGLAAALGLGGLVVWLLGRTVVRRLHRVRDVANRLREGDSEARTKLGGRDEIGDLARDFDLMADALLEAAKDPLTGLLNHRAFQERLAEELRRAERGEYPVAVVALDLDDFKTINGAGGHVAGDQALRTVAEVLRDELRAGDV
jgi:HAMP domain-containing protein